MGLLGTLVYAGLTISSVVSPFLLTRVETPWPVLSWALVLSAGAAVACAFAPNWYFLAAARFAVGLAHGPMYVFFPVWVNAAAGDGYETRWMGLLQAVGPISNIVCYAGTSMLLHINLSWRVMFLALGAGTFATTLALSAIPRNVWTVSARSDRVVRGMWSFGYAFWALVIFGAAAYFAACGAEYWAQPALVYLGADVKMAPMGFLAVGVAGPGFGTWFGAHCADQLGGYRKRRCRWPWIRYLVRCALRGSTRRLSQASFGPLVLHGHGWLHVLGHAAHFLPTKRHASARRRDLGSVLRKRGDARAERTHSRVSEGGRPDRRERRVWACDDR